MGKTGIPRMSGFTCIMVLLFMIFGVGIFAIWFSFTSKALPIYSSDYKTDILIIGVALIGIGVLIIAALVHFYRRHEKARYARIRAPTEVLEPLIQVKKPPEIKKVKVLKYCKFCHIEFYVEEDENHCHYCGRPF